MENSTLFLQPAYFQGRRGWAFQALKTESYYSEKNLCEQKFKATSGWGHATLNAPEKVTRRGFLSLMWIFNPCGFAGK